MSKCTMFLVGLLILGADPGRAATYFVDALRPDDTGDGTNWATAKKTIQAAVALVASSTGGTVWVTNGVYSIGGAGAAGASNTVALATNMALRGLNGPEKTIIDGGGVRRGVYVATNATLDGFTVRKGYVLYPALGAGVFVENSGYVSNCIVESNFLDYTASAVYPGGGGVALNGGGLIEYCTIRTNKADVGGGGVSCNNGGTVRNCLVYGNNAFYGGGIFAQGRCSLVNCTLTGNSTAAGGEGGGLMLQTQTKMTFFNNMIYGNSSKEWAVWFAGLIATTAWNNCSTPVMGMNCVTSPPVYLDSTNGNYRLVCGSPGIDAGTNMPAVPRDLDGVDRPLDGTLSGFAAWDIGAYEYAPATNAPGLVIDSPADLEVFPWATPGTTVQGTGRDVTDVLSWTNEATGASGRKWAGRVWTVKDVALVPGTNRWTISGTNLYGQATQATVRIERGGFGEPAVTPATNLVAQPFSIVALHGSVNAHVVGTLTWTNLANGASGLLPATPAWTATVARLSGGDSPVVFRGTNLAGVASCATVTVTRTPYLVRYVSRAGSSEAPYTNWTTAATNLQMAVAAAGDGDEVIVTSGRWIVAGGLQLTNGIVVRSVPNARPVITSQLSGRCVLMNHPAAILDGFCLRDGALNAGEGNGGGIACSAGTIQNCLVTECYAYDAVGGVNLAGGTIQNSTICSNRTWNFIATGMRGNPGASVVNCIIRFNYPVGQTTEYNVQNMGASFDHCATTPALGTDCVTNDPLFVSLSANDFRLKGASPCVDAGVDLSAWTDRDFAGRPRPLEGPGGPPPRFDIGAHEFAPFLSASAGAHGTIVPAGEIAIDIGGSTSFVVTANAYYHIGALLTNGAADAAAQDQAICTSVWNNVRYEGTVAAAFAENLAAHGTPEWWLAQYGWTNDFDTAETNDTDTDDFPAWQEQIAGTDPTNGASFFQCLEILPNDFPMIGKIIRWNAATGRLYSVDGNTNLPAGWFGLASNLPPTGVWTDATHGAEGVIHYRLGVQQE